ncbi:hypothetical protein [Asaia astilbis]|uniref:hypothetical protein n=1 Tax=Asaia astilbis TaxID=610244 RepID=UPI000471ED37|nr:hypothetical protein [Asaia astilbis]
MVDLSKTIIAKSDQLNADDLLGGPITVKIQAVKEGNTDQPIAIFYEGCNGKPFYPCKSMRRVLVNVWGKDGADYVGKSMTLFRDAAVKFGGIMVGGIRISHMSGLEKDMPMALQVTKGSKKLYTVKPLKLRVAQAQTQATETQPRQETRAPTTQERYARWLKKAEAPEQVIAVRGKWNGYVSQADESGNPVSDDLQNEVAEMIQKRLDELAANYVGQPEHAPA